MRPTPALILCVLILAAGCGSPLRLKPQYRQREFDRAEQAPPYPLTEEPEALMEPLHGLTLAQARDISLARNHTLEAAAAAVEEARARIDEARAAFLPTLTGTISRTHNRESTVVTIPGGGSFRLSPRYVTRGQLDLSVSLFAFGRDKAFLDAARADLGVEMLNERTARQALYAEVTEGWYRVHNATSQLEVAQDSEAAAKRQLQDSENIYSAGRYTKDEVLIARVNWLRSQQDVLVAENALVHARRVLNVLLARPVDALTEVADPPEFKRVTLDVEQMRSLAVRHNPELVSFRAQREALDLRRQATALSWMPDLIGSVRADHTDFRSASGFATNYQGILGVEFTPINGGRRIAELSRLHAQLARLAGLERQALLEIDLEITKAVLDIADQESRVQLAGTAIESATESYRIIQDKFRNGKSTSQDLLEAQTRLAESRNEYNLGRFARDVLIARLEVLVGVQAESWLGFRD